jgi:CelD/BcsL family acetyltransferase involved in cellulose biosynthesis
MPTIRWIEGSDVFGCWAEPWKELVGASSNATPFQTFEWQDTWFRHFGGSKTPIALAAFEGDDLVGWWPMVRTKGLWPVLRPMGKGPSDYLHPIVRKGANGVCESMASALSDLESVMIDLHQVRSDFAPRLGEAIKSLRHDPIPQATCLVLNLDKPFEAYVQSLSKSLRYDVRRASRPPFSTGNATIKVASGRQVAGSLEQLFRLHELRWRRRWQPGAFPNRLKNFHFEWAQRAEERGWLELSILELEGEPIGALYAMALGEATYYYQAGMDPTKNSISPGTLLVADAIRRATERGDKHFDFLRGDEGYKRRWLPQNSHINYRYLAGDAGVRSGLGVGWNRLGSRIEAKVRARLEAR